MAFRIGRTFARHTYPDTPRGAPAAFANNFAAGPGTGQAIATALPGTPVFTNTNGSTVEAGTLTAQGMPITPKVTGDVIAEAVVNVVNTTEGPINLFVFIQVDGSTSTAPIAAVTVDATGYESIPVVFGIPAILTPGTTFHANLILVASAAGLVLTTSSGSAPLASASGMFLQEVPLPTG